MAEVITRLMTVEDVDAVHEIDLASFAIPWTRDAFAKEAENNCARYLVLCEDGKPVAYAGVWFVLDEGQITNIAVHPTKRGLGYGKRIVKDLIQLSADSGMTFMSLECRRSNVVAQNLYHSVGFIDVGFRKRYYSDNNEDALVMALTQMPEANEENDPTLIYEEE